MSKNKIINKKEDLYTLVENYIKKTNVSNNMILVCFSYYYNTLSLKENIDNANSYKELIRDNIKLIKELFKSLYGYTNPKDIKILEEVKKIIFIYIIDRCCEIQDKKPSTKEKDKINGKYNNVNVLRHWRELSELARDVGLFDKNIIDFEKELENIYIKYKEENKFNNSRKEFLNLLNEAKCIVEEIKILEKNNCSFSEELGNFKSEFEKFKEKYTNKETQILNVNRVEEDFNKRNQECLEMLEYLRKYNGEVKNKFEKEKELNEILQGLEDIQNKPKGTNINDSNQNISELFVFNDSTQLYEPIDIPSKVPVPCVKELEEIKESEEELGQNDREKINENNNLPKSGIVDKLSENINGIGEGMDKFMNNVTNDDKNVSIGSSEHDKNLKNSSIVGIH